MNARQDVWAARLDTVGYGVNADVLDRYGEDGWQVAACADLCAYLSELRPLNPQALAENVLAAALGRSPKGEAGDDMTVLAVRVDERA